MFYKYKNVKVLQNMSFSISKNDVTALVGNNGCGKTTTIKLLCGLLFSERGKVTVYGKKVDKNYVEFRSDMGIILDTPYYVEEFNTIEYLNFVCKFQHVSKEMIKERVNDISSLLDLQNEMGKPINKLSSGNQMKVSIAAALIHNPQILVLDEPFINLDINTTEKIMSVLKTLKGKKTMLITSHNLDLIVELCDRFLIMDQGKIILEANKSDYATPELLKASVKERLTERKDVQDIEWLG